jgi:hypothetical protein
MANLSFELIGMDDLRQALRDLPANLQTQAAAIVHSTAHRVATETIADYPEVTGNLRRGVKVTEVGSIRGGVKAMVWSRSPHSHLYERGSYLTKNRKITGPWRHGASTGTMPAASPNRTLVGHAIPARRAMLEALIALVRAAGFEVHA